MRDAIFGQWLIALGIIVPIVVIYLEVRKQRREPVETFDEWFERNWS